MALNPLIGVVRRKLSYREFAAIVRAKHPELVAAQLLHGCLMALDGIRSCCLGSEQLSPHIAGGIIDEQ